jgi:hypothetical protein
MARIVHLVGRGIGGSFTVLADGRFKTATKFTRTGIQNRIKCARTRLHGLTDLQISVQLLI